MFVFYSVNLGVYTSTKRKPQQQQWLRRFFLSEKTLLDTPTGVLRNCFAISGIPFGFASGTSPVKPCQCCWNFLRKNTTNDADGGRVGSVGVLRRTFFSGVKLRRNLWRLTEKCPSAVIIGGVFPKREKFSL